MRNLLFILLLFLTVSSVSADKVYIHINGTLDDEINITKTYPGIGVQVKNITDNTLQINIPNFIELFAPIGATTRTYPSFLRRLVIDDILDSINITDKSGVTHPPTSDDIKIQYGNSINKIYVYNLLQYTYQGQHYKSTIRGSGYIVGWRNSRGSVLLDGNSISDKLYPDWYTPVVLTNGNHTLSTSSGYSGGLGYTVIDLSVIGYGSLTVSGRFSQPNVERIFSISPITYPVSIYTEPGAHVYIDGINVGTTDNGGYLKAQVPCGEHTLKITKDGFWDYTKTINIQNDTTLHISLAPKTALFRVEKNITSNLYPNSIGDVKLHLEPIRTAYGTQMTISGVDVVKVYYKNSLLAPSNGAYVLGTVDGPVDVEIQFKTPSSWGEHSFAVTISSSDIEGNSYTNQEQITYDVKELPFLLQTPNTWKIGDNIVTITDQSGEDSSVLLSLKTLDGKEIWSQSQGFNAYDSYDFTVPINQSGDYVLEILAKGGQVKTYVPVHVIDPIQLLTPEVNATKGGVATIKLKIQNPSSSVKYFDATVMGEIFDVNDTPKQTFSISPGETKTVELKFQVPENLTYDNYNLNVEVFEKGEADPCFEGDVVLNIITSFLPFGAGGDSEIPRAIAVVGILLIVGIGVYFLRRGD